MVRPMAVFDLPSSRTDRLTEGAAVRHARRPQYAVADTPDCRLTYWGHRVVAESPPWEVGLPRCFGWWVAEHGHKGLTKAYVAFEAEPWDAMEAPAPPPGATVDANNARSLEELRPWRPVQDVELRPLTSDADWAELLAFSIESNDYGDDPAGQGYLRWQHGVRRQLVRRGGTQLGAYAGGRLVGAAALLSNGQEARYQDVAVASAFRKRGIATALVGTLARDARARRPHLPIWITSGVGTQADRIYERLGFAKRSLGWCWAMDAPLTEEEIRRRWALLKESTLPMEEWRHRDHLWGAVCVLRDNGGDLSAALDALRAVLQRFLLALGVETTDETGYHETLTRGWLTVVGQQMAAHPGDTLVEAAIRAQLAFADKRYLLRHWNRDTMMSRAARYGWVPPDLAPFADAS